MSHVERVEERFGYPHVCELECSEEHPTVDAELVDSKGRQDASSMTDRALLIEMVRSQRQLSDLVENFMSSMDKNPMMKMFAGKMGR
jgi:hypothetical protein